MTTLPNPFLSSAVLPPGAADGGTARAPAHAQPEERGPAPPNNRKLLEEITREYVAAHPPKDDWRDIHEIFHHARILMREEHRFVLDKDAFLAAIEDVPLFLRRSA